MLSFISVFCRSDARVPNRSDDKEAINKNYEYRINVFNREILKAKEKIRTLESELKKSNENVKNVNKRREHENEHSRSEIEKFKKIMITNYKQYEKRIEEIHTIFMAIIRESCGINRKRMDECNAKIWQLTEQLRKCTEELHGCARINRIYSQKFNEQRMASEEKDRDLATFADRMQSMIEDWDRLQSALRSADDRCVVLKTKLTRTKDRLENRSVIARDVLDNMEKELCDKKRTIRDGNNLRLDLESQLAEERETRAELERSNNERITKLETELSSIRAVSSKLGEESVLLQESLSTKNEEVQLLRVELSEINRTIRDNRKLENRLNEEREKLTQGETINGKQISLLQTELSSTERVSRKLEAELIELQECLSVKNDELERMNAELNDKSRKIEQDAEIIKRLEERLADERVDLVRCVGEKDRSKTVAERLANENEALKLKIKNMGTIIRDKESKSLTEETQDEELKYENDKLRCQNEALKKLIIQSIAENREYQAGAENYTTMTRSNAFGYKVDKFNRHLDEHYLNTPAVPNNSLESVKIERVVKDPCTKLKRRVKKHKKRVFDLGEQRAERENLVEFDNNNHFRNTSYRHESSNNSIIPSDSGDGLSARGTNQLTTKYRSHNSSRRVTRKKTEIAKTKSNRLVYSECSDRLKQLATPRKVKSAIVENMPKQVPLSALMPRLTALAETNAKRTCSDVKTYEESFSVKKSALTFVATDRLKKLAVPRRSYTDIDIRHRQC